VLEEIRDSEGIGNNSLPFGQSDHDLVDSLSGPHHMKRETKQTQTQFRGCNLDPSMLHNLDRSTDHLPDHFPVENILRRAFNWKEMFGEGEQRENARRKYQYRMSVADFSEKVVDREMVKW
jgi:hypothetical protein